ncbi:MAG TPA: hypothetical protein ENF16_06190 [Bacteroidetes bacterium]|nr:hypothetical protein [Bacteroidota bacterium]
MNTRYSKLTVLVIVLVIAAFLLTSAAFAKNKNRQGEEESSKPILVEKIVKIIDKGTSFVEIKHEGKFKIDSSTLIYSPDNMKIFLIFLKVPCWAKIKYYEGEGSEPIVKEIHALKPSPE